MSIDMDLNESVIEKERKRLLSPNEMVGASSRNFRISFGEDIR